MTLEQNAKRIATDSTGALNGLIYSRQVLTRNQIDPSKINGLVANPRATGRFLPPFAAPSPCKLEAM